MVQQLINESVSLLIYPGSEGEEEGEESDGSLRSGAGEGGEGGSERRGSGSRRRARPGGFGWSQGKDKLAPFVHLCSRWIGHDYACGIGKYCSV